MSRSSIAKEIEINGIVQGVGFRPFIFQLARRYNLTGQVSNTAQGVLINVEGEPDEIDAFLSAIPSEHPPLAHIVHMAVSTVIPMHLKEFKIGASNSGKVKATLISPDVSICKDCLKEIFDPTNRRYRYPFTNCTNCGPRYTIINDVPYDRPKTAMAEFIMCPLCQAEYDDPMNRRFHAQPNACPDCGPKVELYGNLKKRIKTGDPIKTAAQLLKKGSILAIKGLGGYHLAVDATLTEAVIRLRKRKQREEKPLALMSPSTEKIDRFAHISQQAADLLTGIQRPIVLLDKKNPNPIAPQVAPENRYFGVMLPYTPLHYLLLSEGFTALVMTSANLSEEPIAIDNEEAFERLSHIADYFLIHNRDIYLRSDDSILSHLLGAPRFIRRSRGYVPIPIFLNQKLPQLLACGAELKNTICLTKDQNAFVSQHIGDLENLATENFLHLTVSHLKRILDITPEAVVCDLHPDYPSTRYAKETGLPLIQIQHHHAHIAACMAENQIQGPVIGLAFDGTGLGTDHTIWGGEVLIADYLNFKRAAHLAYVPMPGSSMAIKEPWRMAISHLISFFRDNPLPSDIPLIQTIEEEKVATIAAMVKKKINAPMTSSLGRLFDAAAALLGLGYTVTFEGQAAMALEMIADRSVSEHYDLPICDGDPIQIETAPLIGQVVTDLQKKIPHGVISAKFHHTLTITFAEICRRLHKKTGIDKVVLSGGVFQNALLLKGLSTALNRCNFNIYMHRLVPTNDGGISLGQAAVAGHRLIINKNGEVK